MLAVPPLARPLLRGCLCLCAWPVPTWGRLPPVVEPGHLRGTGRLLEPGSLAEARLLEGPMPPAQLHLRCPPRATLRAPGAGRRLPRLLGPGSLNGPWQQRGLGRAAWPLSLGGPWALAGAWFIAGARAAGRAPADCKAPAAPPGPGPWAGTGRLAGACKPTGPCLCSLNPPPSQSRVFCAPRLLY